MVLALKLFLTPIFIALVSLAGRRWGPAVSGWMIGLPLTSGPVSFILATQYGPAFAVQAATGTLAGQASVLVFCLAYSLAAQKWGWGISSIVSILAFFASTFAWNYFPLTLLPTLALLLVIMLVVIQSIPHNTETLQAIEPPRWDLPARMFLAAAFVFLLTTYANSLGPQLSGLISPFPVFGVILAIFAHRQQGAMAAARLLRGTAIGALAFATFFVVVAVALPHLGLGITYLLSSLAALAVNGASLVVMQRKNESKPGESL